MFRKELRLSVFEGSHGFLERVLQVIIHFVFESAECGAEFEVVVESSEGDRRVFGFAHICEEGK